MHHLTVETVGKTFEVNVCRIKIGADMGQCFRSDIAVGDENVFQSGGLGKDGGVKSVFIKYGRLRIGIGNRRAAACKGLCDNISRR